MIEEIEEECSVEEESVDSVIEDSAPVNRIKGRPGRPKKIHSGNADDYIPVIRLPKVSGRGRGRPPGTAKIPGPNDPPLPSRPMKIYGGSHKKHDGNPFMSRTFGQSNCPSQSIYPSQVSGAGVQAILGILEKSEGKRPFWPSEKLIISQMKEWSPIEDLQIVHKALILHKEMLLDKIRILDNNFIEPLCNGTLRNIKNNDLLIKDLVIDGNLSVNEDKGSVGLDRQLDVIGTGNKNIMHVEGINILYLYACL